MNKVYVLSNRKYLPAYLSAFIVVMGGFFGGFSPWFFVPVIMLMTFNYYDNMERKNLMLPSLFLIFGSVFVYFLFFIFYSVGNYFSG